MKKILITFFMLILLISSGCDESFNPFGEFKEKFVLTGIIRGDSSFQFVTLKENYFVEGFDPTVYSGDPNVYNAEVKINIGDSVYFLQDSLIQIVDSSGNTDVLFIYYSNTFIPKKNDLLKLEVLLEDGKRLNSSTLIPGEIFFDAGNSTVIPPVNSNLLTLRWNSQREGTFFDVRFLIEYSKNINGTEKTFSREVPIDYLNDEPVFPLASRQSSVVYKLSAIQRFFTELSEGDNDKGSYSVKVFPRIEIMAFDQSLSRYFSSSSRSFDDLTVRVNETDFSNIDGGLGIFGSVLKKKINNIVFLTSFIESFGYNVQSD